jgi:ketosteroid isomerase-like protein
MAMTKEDVAEAVRAWCTAWQTRDMQTIIAMEARAGGFGFRPFTRRDHIANARGEARERQLERFFNQKESYSLVLEDCETAVVGDVGLAWGTYLETWQDQGHPPEQARVRFSKVLTRGESGWEVVLYHRDIQPFTAEGRYPRELTVVAPAHEGGRSGGLDG